MPKNVVDWVQLTPQALAAYDAAIAAELTKIRNAGLYFESALIPDEFATAMSDGSLEVLVTVPVDLRVRIPPNGWTWKEQN